MFDYLNRFADDQAITASAASEYTIDTGAARSILGLDNPVGVFIAVKETFDSAANDSTLAIALQDHDDDAFGATHAIMSAAAIAEADLVPGAAFFLPIPVQDFEQYLRLYFTVAGSGNFTAGKLDAYLCPLSMIPTNVAEKIVFLDGVVNP